MGGEGRGGEREGRGEGGRGGEREGGEGRGREGGRGRGEREIQTFIIQWI